MSNVTENDAALTPDCVVVVAMDAPVAGTPAVFERAFFLCRGSDLLSGGGPKPLRVLGADLLEGENAAVFSGLDREGSKGRVHVILYPTRTYSEGMGGTLFSDLAPEDRRMIRSIRNRYDGRTRCLMVPLGRTGLFESLPGFLQNDEETSKFKAEKSAPPAKADTGPAPKRSFFEFDSSFLSNMKAIFASCMTRPNRQDYAWLATKTFGLNLAVRLAFMVPEVRGGKLPILRALCSFVWYQLQDAVFTVFGQTYMKFLGRMTGMLRLGRAYVGDFVFVYIQLCGFEFLNRLVLGPLGENPLVYTPGGIGLIFANILQGMLSGGPLIPAINKMRRAGVISHSTMMHLYQLSSLTMQFGLFATFGYQRFYAFLTGAILVLAWSSYVAFSTLYKDPEFGRLEDEALTRDLDKYALACWSSRAPQA